MTDRIQQTYNHTKSLPDKYLEKTATSIAATMNEAVLLLDNENRVLGVSRNFEKIFKFSKNNLQASIFEISSPFLNAEKLQVLLKEKLLKEERVDNFSIGRQGASIKVNAAKIDQGENRFLILLNFWQEEAILAGPKDEEAYKKLLNEIVSQAPAMLCTLRGPDHTFELANENYLQLVGNRDIIGKTVKEALPEVENQGFIEILNNVYNTGEPYIGNEIPVKLYVGEELKNSLLDFVYQPTWNSNKEVDGIFVHAIDVTERVLNRRKLEESEHELQILIETVPVIIWITDEQGRSTYLNSNWYNYTGQSREEEIAMGWLKKVHPDDRDAVKREFLNALEERKSISLTYRLETREGDYRWAMDTARPKYGLKGDFEGMIGTVVDIHEDKVKEQLILEKEHRTRSIVEQATVATALYTGLEMKVEMANDAMLDVWGKGRNVVGKRLEEILPELDGQPFNDLLKKVYLTGETYWGREDKVDLMIDGKLQTGYFNFTYKALRNEKGEIYGILNMAVDVTETVNSKLLLKEREKHFRQMADLMPEKVTNTDKEGKAVYFNQNWLDYTGMSSEELREKGWTGLIHPAEQPVFDSKWKESLEKNVHFETEVRIRNKEGAYLWHLSRAEAVQDNNGEVTMWICTNTEIQRLKEEEKRKEDFLKMVSHELKTPVTSMKGYVQLLLTVLERTTNQELLDMPFKPSLERIDHQIVRLTRLISEMLDLSRIEEGKLELQKEKFSINNLVDDTIQDIILTNTQHKIDIHHDVRLEVFADKDRIGQVLINLVTNAIKYSPESNHVEILVTKNEDREVMVKVRDRGIGIEEKFQKNIFKRFYRIGVESEETYSGFGIGLYLANEIMQRHKGRIEVESKVGKGSEFSLVLAEAP